MNKIKVMKNAKKENDHIPDYWTNHRTGNKKILVPVDQRTFKAIKEIVHRTWNEELIGKGLDAKGLEELNYTKLDVIMVQRVENPQVFGNYQRAKNELIDKMIALRKPSRRIESIPGEKGGDPDTTQDLDDFMKRDLCPEINECYVLHGTKVERIGGLSDRGLNLRQADPNAMFGKGIYTTDSSTKADQYADSPVHRRPLNYRNKLILSRVLLGNVYLCKEKPRQDEQKLSGPPCLNCLKDMCRCNGPKFDSVLGERYLRFREFVTYDTSNIYPEYVITYKRAK
uniref:Poly [ADP-ribose] polymerase n=1 Tax=Biomphalaria glabrata TaxID=6526 RepID=A0A2C9LI78_BIOGL